MNHALYLARQERFDWLAIFDPDEFAFANNPGRSAIERAHLPAMLRHIATTTRRFACQLANWCLHSWRKRVLSGSSAIFKRIRASLALHDPQTGETHVWRGFIGHREGKHLMRTSLSVQGYSSHRWVPEQGRRFPDRPQFVPLPTEDRGWHWHFFTSSQRQWRSKFRKQAFQAERWPCGSPVALPKLLWRRAADARMRASRTISSAGSRDHSSSCARSQRSDASWSKMASRRCCSEAGHLAGDMLILPERSTKGVAEPFYPVRSHGQSLARDALGRVLDYPAALTPVVDLQGAHPLELHCGEVFRWLEPHAALRLHTTPARYWLRMHMGDL